MAENRTAREVETRDKTVRKRSWRRPETLPSPDPEPGWDFRWVRISTLGLQDPVNVTGKLREGWEPVKAADYPNIYAGAAENDRFKDNIVIGGLLLCKAPKEMVEERNEFYREQADAQIRSVDQNFMRQNDPRMPLFAERKSEVRFGRGQ